MLKEPPSLAHKKLADMYSYLGVLLERRLTFRQHIMAKKQQIINKYKKLWWLLRPKSGLTTYNKLLLYKVVLKPVWTYACPLWGCAKKTNINEIQTADNLILRGLSGVRWDDYLHLY